jgi:hypothetical protein
MGFGLGGVCLYRILIVIVDEIDLTLRQGMNGYVGMVYGIPLR